MSTPVARILSHLLAAAAGACLVLLIPRGDERPAKPDPAESAKASPRTTAGGRADGTPPEDMGRILRAMESGPPSPAALEAYLTTQNRSVEALLAAGILNEDDTLVLEALEKDPDNPHALFVAIGLTGRSKEERLAWSKHLHELQPDNALASYVLAARLFENGETESAVQTLGSIQDQGSFEDFSAHTALALEDAFRGTGSSPLESKLRSAFGSPIRYLSDLNRVAAALESRRVDASPEDAERLRIITASMGSRLAGETPSKSVLTQAVGLSLQRTSLEKLPDDAPSPYEGLTVAEARKSLDAQREEIRTAAQNFPDLETFPSLDPQIVAGYLDRTRLLGEMEAARWLRDQTHPTP